MPEDRSRRCSFRAFACWSPPPMKPRPASSWPRPRKPLPRRPARPVAPAIRTRSIAVGIALSARLRPAGCILREVVSTAFWTVPERLNLLVLRRDRVDLPVQIGGVGGSPGVRRNPQIREHAQRSGAPPPCPPGDLPGGPAFGAGPRVCLWLPREPHATIVATRRGSVKRLPGDAAGQAGAAGNAAR